MRRKRVLKKKKRIAGRRTTAQLLNLYRMKLWMCHMSQRATVYHDVYPSETRYSM